MPKGIYKHKTHTEQWKKQMKERMKSNQYAKGNKPNSGSFKIGHKKSLNAFVFKIGYTPSKKTKEKISISHLGKSQTEEHKINRVESRKKNTPYPFGKNHFNWKGGVTPINHKVRNSLELKLWKKMCLERDNFTDKKTNIRGGDLEIHHINNFTNFPELRTSIENGITLSKKTHKEFHKKYGYKNNTREQLEEFLKN